MATLLEQHEELGKIQQKWPRLFNEELKIGFEIDVSQLPILRECVKNKTTKPLKKYLREVHKTRRDY